MAYYSSETCGYVNGSWVDTGCTTDYAQSEVKYVVDTWKNAQAAQALDARIINMDYLIDNLGYSWNITSAGNPAVNDDVPSWVYNSNYYYWTMSQYRDLSPHVWIVGNDGTLRNYIS